MNFQHKNLADGAWHKLSLIQQMANLGSEALRTLNWKKKHNPAYARLAFERTLELFDLTISDPKNKKRLREILRAREIFCDFMDKNTYNSTDEGWQKYFYNFNYATRISK